MTWQVSLFLENKIGRLEKATSVLRDAGINGYGHVVILSGALNDLFISGNHLVVTLENDVRQFG